MISETERGGNWKTVGCGTCGTGKQQVTEQWTREFQDAEGIRKYLCTSQPDADYIPGASGIRRGGDCLGQRYLGQRKHFKPCDRRGAGGSWYGYFGSKLFRVNC